MTGPRYFATVCAAGFYALAVLDASRDLGWLPFTPAVVAFVLCLVASASLLRRLAKSRSETERISQSGIIALLLFAGATLSLGVRVVGLESVLRRTEQTWLEHQREDGRAIAETVSGRFAALSRDARETARRLSRTSQVAVAVEGSDAQDYLTAAFDVLSAAVLPRAHPDGVPGVTLYDARRRPLAWAGENVSIEPYLAEHPGTPESEVFLLERGVLVYLVAVEPLLSKLGFVTVEIPLVADRRLQNRYVEDFDATAYWSGRSVDTDFLSFSDDDTELVAWFESRGERFWGGTTDAPRLYFPLVSDEGRILASASIPGESPIVGRLEARRRLTIASAAALSVAAFGVLFVVFTNLGSPRSESESVRSGSGSSPSPFALIGALWVARLVPLFAGLPLGLGLDLSNPAHYAAPLPFGLASSPIDLLLTAVSVLVTVRVLSRRAIEHGRDGRAPSKLGTRFAPLLVPATCVAGLTLIALIARFVQTAWFNSSLPLLTVRITPFNTPALTVQVAFALLFISATALVAWLFSFSFSFSFSTSVDPATGRRNDNDGGEVALRRFVLTISVLAIGSWSWWWLVSAESAFAESVLLAFPPLIVAWILARLRGASSAPLTPLTTTFVSVLLSVASFYPALARSEAASIRAFVETTVKPLILQHGRSRMFVLTETAQAIDRMADNGRLGRLEREDQAFRIWVGTDLYASFLSSSLAILDDDGVVRSRFAVGLPLSEAPEQRTPAPSEWVWEEQLRAPDPRQPGVIVARRSIGGPGADPWEIRLELAADWKNLPFISTSNPYLSLIRPAGVEASRFPHRELDLFVLAPDGMAVYGSSTGNITLDRASLDSAASAANWLRLSVEDQILRGHVFSDESYIYALGFPEKNIREYAAEVAAWLLLGGALFAVGVVLSLVSEWAGRPGSFSSRELFSDLRSSFYSKLYAALVLVALVPIVFVSFFVRNIFVQQLQRDIEHEGIARARVVERFVTDLIVFERRDLEPEGAETVTDGVLEWLSGLADVEVDLYREGELLATSKPELFSSGLLGRRVAPTAYRDVVLRHHSQSIHQESVGSFPYRVVAVPLALGAWREPGILSLPLASRQREIEQKVEALNESVLLLALAFVLAAAALARSIARRIADPVNMLTVATHRVATGDLDVTLDSTSRDEIGRLSASFNRMTADLKRQRDDLERTKKLEAWAEMARQVAHEVKNPLTPIQLAAEHLRRVHRDPNVDFDRVLEECSETILQQVRTLRQISMEFSTFASPEPLRREPTDIASLVRESVSPYLNAPPNGVTLAVESEPNLPLVEADERLLKRTLVNLVENALQAVNGAGEVRIEITGDTSPGDGSGSVVVDVSDTGAGVDRDIQARVFEPYFSTRAAGTGLGLAIAKKVVEDHGGEISLTSTPGSGTTVRLRLPARAS